MKRLTLILLAAVLTMPLAGCGTCSWFQRWRADDCMPCCPSEPVGCGDCCGTPGPVMMSPTMQGPIMMSPASPAPLPAPTAGG